MDNWFVNKNEIKKQMENAIMNELEYLLGEIRPTATANYWLDNTHNVFAFINDNGNNDRWIEIHYELYDSEEEVIGDLMVLSTDDINKRELLEQVRVIVDDYYGD